MCKNRLSGPAMWCALLQALIGAVVSAALFSAFQFWAQGEDFSSAASREILLVVGGVGAVGAAFAGLLCRRRPAPLPEPEPSTFLERAVSGNARKKRRRRHLQARLSPQFRWLALSAAMERWLRRKAARLQGKSFLKVVHPEDISLVDVAFQEALSKKGTGTVGFRLLVQLPPSEAGRVRRRKDSDTTELPKVEDAEVRHVSMRVRPRFQEGTLFELRCTFIDRTRVANAVTGRARAEVNLSLTRDRLRRMQQALDRLKESYRDLYHNAPVMYFSLDTAGRFVSFNDTLVRTLGYQRAELSRRSYRDVLAPAALAEFEKHLRVAGQGTNYVMAKEEQVETFWKTRAGSYARHLDPQRPGARRGRQVRALP